MKLYDDIGNTVSFGLPTANTSILETVSDIILDITQEHTDLTDQSFQRSVENCLQPKILM